MIQKIRKTPCDQVDFVRQVSKRRQNDNFTFKVIKKGKEITLQIL